MILIPGGARCALKAVIATQIRVADQLAISEWTYLLWENDRAEPLTRYYPAIFAFLGYDPFPPPTTLAGQIAAKRRQLGLSIKKTARLLGVDEGTFAGWENGGHRPLLSGEQVVRFLAALSPENLLQDRLPKRARPEPDEVNRSEVRQMADNPVSKV